MKQYEDKITRNDKREGKTYKDKEETLGKRNCMCF